MCFYLDKNEKLIAKKDIECYKIFLGNKNRINSICFYDMVWKVGVLVNESKKENVLLIDHDNNVIGVGLHSYKIKELINKSWFNISIKAKCIIPKGANYYENESEYVSDQLKIVKIIKDYNKYE